MRTKKNPAGSDVERLTDYTVQRKIGEGMLGKVYKAVDNRSDDIVALKVLRPEASMHAQRLQNEFRLLSTLHHPHLADVFDYGLTDTGRPFYAMEWIPGNPASKEMFLSEDGSINTQRIAQFIRQISSALIYLRSRNIAHGDIKPENILVNTGKGTEMRAVLMDFGISRSYASGSDGLSGTFEYLAPEIIRGDPPSAASDLYALGCVLYEIVTGKPPFQAEAPLEILKQHLNTPPPAIPSELGIDPALAGWIDTLLAKDVRLRFRIPEQLYSLACEFLKAEPEVQLREQDAFSAQLIHVPRENEYAKLHELAEAAKTASQFIVIEGVDGLGKSRLLKDFRVQLQMDGRSVRLITSGNTLQPFAPMISFLSTIPIREETKQSASIFASFFPEVYPEVEPASKSGMDADGEITRLFHAAATLAAASGLDAILFDDIHEMDDLSLEFIGNLVSFVDAESSNKVLIAVAFNPETINRDLFTAEIQNLGTTIPLQPLSKEIVKKNIDAIFSAEMTPSFHAFLWNQSRGNPANVEDILQYCIDEGIVEKTRHGWILHERDDLAQALPTSVIEKTKHRLSKLGDNTALLLKALALSESPVDPPVLEFVVRKGIDRIHELGMLLLKYDLMDLIDGRYKTRTGLIRPLLEYQSGEVQSIHARYVEYYGAHPESAPATGLLAEHYFGAGKAKTAADMYLSASKEAERIYDYAGTRRFLAKALEIPEVTEIDEVLFTSYQSMVRVCNILGDRNKESEYIEELLILAGRWKGKKGAERLANAYELQTEYYLALGEFDKAVRSAERALRNYEEANTALGIARCQQKLGFILYRTKPTAKIIEYYQKAQAIYAQHADIIDEANILIDIGLVHYSILNNPEEALRCYREAREKFLHAGMERGAARAYGNAGVQYYVLANYEAAFEHHRMANEIFTRIGDHRATAISLLHIGRSHYALGDYVKALDATNQALRIGKTLADSYVVENSYESLGEIYFHLGLYEKSRECFLLAKELAVKSGFTLGEITNTLDIAEIEIENGNIDAALGSISACEEKLKEIKDAKVECGCIFRYGQAFMAKGAAQDFNKAIEYLTRLNDLASQQGHDDYRILAYSYAGLCHAHLGRVKEALDLSTNSIVILGDAKYLVGGKQDILLNHAKILRANKNTDEAEDFIQRAYDETMRIASCIDDPNAYRSFTEKVAINAEVIREYSLLHRYSPAETLSVSKDQNLKVLYDVSRKINSTLDLSQLLENIMDSALEAMNGERGLIFLLEDNELALKASRNVERETIKDATEISLSILKDVVSGGQPIIIADTAKDDASKKRESVVNYNIRSIICVPMKSKDNIIGTVYVDSRSDALSAMSFSEIDVDFLVAFSNLATIAIENARLHLKLQEENLFLKQEVSRQFGFDNIVGASKPMENLFRETQGAIASEDSVLIYGESGTGKELIARAIHYNGSRKDRRFVAIDCGAFQDTLLESELFGYKRGAFTGAVADKRGLFEEAHKGTLFLDEIGNTSLAFQAKLLRVLQSGEFRRVGDTDTRKVDVRIIAATNTNLQQQIVEGVFRQDLFYRLNVIPLHVPELRERLDDIPLLVQHFVQEYNKKHNTHFQGGTREFMDMLQAYSWPGNVRELENLVSRILVQTDAEIIETRHIPADFDLDAGRKQFGKAGVSLKMPSHLKTLKEVEQNHILSVLDHTGNNKSEAAKILGLKRTTLVERMKKLGLM